MRHHNISPLLEQPLGDKEEVREVLSGTDPSNITLMLYNKKSGKTTFVMNGKVVQEIEQYDPRIRWSLSFDGSKLVVAFVSYNTRSYRVFINGVLTHEVPFSKRTPTEDVLIFHLDWISNTQFLWNYSEGSRRGHDQKYFTYLNGDNVTGKLDWQRFFPSADGDMDLVVGNFETRIWWKVNRRGETYDHQPMPRSAKQPMMSDMLEARRLDEGPQINEKGKGHVVEYLGKTSPTFDAIGYQSNERPVVSPNGQDVGYIGVKISSGAKAVMRVGMALVEFHEEHAKDPLAPIAFVGGWTAALLCNPYVGPVHYWHESSQRYYPGTLSTGVWKKGYSAVWNQFFLPTNELVVTAYNWRKQFVVVDQVEGPKFDTIYNVLYLPASNELTYIGRRGDEFFRVIATQA